LSLQDARCNNKDNAYTVICYNPQLLNSDLILVPKISSNKCVTELKSTMQQNVLNSKFKLYLLLV